MSELISVLILLKNPSLRCDADSRDVIAAGKATLQISCSSNYDDTFRHDKRSALSPIESLNQNLT
jgi:hypothetical protein